MGSAVLAACAGAAPSSAPPAAPAATGATDAGSPLSLQVFTSSPAGFLVNATLVSGARDALLIDSDFVLSDARHLVDEIKATNKHLTAVYVTHFHPDHYFGFVALKQAFPDVKLVALPATVEEIQRTALAKVKQWQPMFKQDIPAQPIVPEPLAGTTLMLEGHELTVIGNQQGDTPGNSYVVIPSLSAVICGDIVYAGCFHGPPRPRSSSARPGPRRSIGSRR